MNVFIEGFLLQASLILALGAQNLFVIDTGLKKNHHLLAATICAVCDVLLIVLGVVGVSAIIVKTPVFKVFVGTIGALFLLYYSALKLVEAYKGVEVKGEDASKKMSKRLVVMATLGFTLLNPHVYIDTFFLVGGYSTRFVELLDKLKFAFGAGFFSVIWFYFLAICSSKFSGSLTKEKNIRIASFITGIVLGILSIRLGLDSYYEFLD